MALQIPVTTRTTKANATSSWPTPALAPNGNPGLRCLSNRFGLRSSFFTPSLNLLLPPPYRQQSSAYVPRFSMRLASKQAYICRDCGYRYLFLSWVAVSFIFTNSMMCVGIFTTTELPLRNCLTSTSALVTIIPSLITCTLLVLVGIAYSSVIEQRYCGLSITDNPDCTYE